MKKYITRTTSILTSVGFAVALLMITGCGGGGGDASAPRPTMGAITFSFRIPGKAARAPARASGKIPSDTSYLEIAYVNDDISDEPVVQTISGLQEVNTVTINNIPVGETFFKIFAFDAGGNLIAATSEVAWIEDGVVTTLYAELGMIFDGQNLLPSSMALDAGETLNIKVAVDLGTYPMTISGTNCPATGLTFANNSQLACTFKTAGTYNVTVGGQNKGTAVVSQGTATTFLAANASSQIGYGMTPVSVQFAGGAVSSTTGATFTYAWDFGDGATSTQQNPTHTYSSVGSYLAVLTVTDNSGNTATDRVNIHVTTLRPPEVVSVTPAFGDNAAETNITISGEEFQEGATVLIGGSAAVNVVVVSDDLITATVPAGLATGVYDITVTNLDDQYGVLAGAFTVSGTSAATYNTADYFPMNSGDSRIYIYDYVNDDVSTDALETESVLGSETVNGATCTQVGTSASEYECFSLDAQGLRMHKKVSNSGSTIVVFAAPIKIIDAAFNVGDSFTDSQTASVTSSGQTANETISVSVSVMAAGVSNTPAGSFSDTITLSLTRTTPGGVDNEISTFANGIGIIKSAQTNNTSCSANECVRILKAATVGGTAYPVEITPGVDGQYWVADIAMDTSGGMAWSGAYTMSISGNTASIDGDYGTFVSGPSPNVNTLSFTPYGNGVFTISGSPDSLGLMGTSGVGAIMDMGTTKGIKVFAKKGASYTSSMIEGNYWGVSYGISSGSPSVVSASFFEATLSGGSMTMTGYRSDSSGTYLEPISQSDSYAFNTADGTFSMTSQGADYAGMVGENGNVILDVKQGPGDREIVILIKKGGGLSFASSNGGYLSGNFWKSTNFDSSFSFVDVKADGMMGNVNFNGNGTYEIQAFTASLDSSGRMYITGAPDYYSAFDQSGTIGFSVGLETDDIEIDFIIHAQ